MCGSCKAPLYVEAMEAYLRVPRNASNRFVQSVLQQTRDRGHITPKQAEAIRRAVGGNERTRTLPTESRVPSLLPDNAQDLEGDRTPPVQPKFSPGDLFVTIQDTTPGMITEAIFIYGRNEQKYRVEMFPQGVVRRTLMRTTVWESMIRKPTPSETPWVSMAYMEVAGDRQP